MLYQHSIERALASKIGPDGIADAAFAAVLQRTEPALAALRVAYEQRTLPLLRLPERTDDLPALQAAAKKLQEGTDVVFLGTGGSSLGGQTVAQLADYGVPGLAALRKEPRVHFLDNLDPITLGAALQHLPLKTTNFVAISKSGGTAETLMQLMAAMAALKKAGVNRPGDRIVGLSEPAVRRNVLRDLLSGSGAALLDHEREVGGRYSVLSNVGLLPALVLGLDGKAMRDGARRTLAQALEKRQPVEVPAAVGAALNVAAAQAGKNIAVLMAYADRLERFTKWWMQLWAESLGKSGRGTTPVAALGPVDQHSQLQLYLAGPRDKLFTVMTTDAAGRGPRIDQGLADKAGEGSLGGKAVGDLVAAQGRATIETLAANGCPVRTIHLSRLDVRSLGALMMHFMLETIIAAHLLEVDPFDQPAVEAGKVLAKRYLAGS
jgi:glucose-6-phosphate isomerase